MSWWRYLIGKAVSAGGGKKAPSGYAEYGGITTLGGTANMAQYGGVTVQKGTVS